jgi:hypothetical protein
MYYFRFKSRRQFRTLAAAQGLIDADGNLITSSHTHAIDELGTIYQGGEYDPETGDVIEPPTLLDGWHVNFIGDIPEEWEDYLVSPENPVRVFAS